MDLNISTPAVIFPSISFLLIAFTNRFLAIASLIRDLKLKFSNNKDELLVQQIKNLRYRLWLIRWMQAIALMSMLLAMLSIFFLQIEIKIAANICFYVSISLVLLSLVIALIETMFSGRAVDFELQDIQDHLNEKKKA